MKNKITSEWSVCFFLRGGKINGYLYSRRQENMNGNENANCSEIHVGFFTLWNSHWKFNTQTTTWIYMLCEVANVDIRRKPNHNTREEQKNTPIKKEHNQREPTTIEPKIHGFSPIVDSQFINSYFVCELLMANNGFVKKRRRK